MSLHTIEVAGIPDDLLRRLDQKVQERGGDRSGYIREMLEKDLREDAPRSGTAFDEIAAPLRQDFQASGMTEEELDALIEAAREDIWQERHRRSGLR